MHKTLQFAVTYKAVKLNNINFWIELMFIMYNLNKGHIDNIFQ